MNLEIHGVSLGWLDGVSGDGGAAGRRAVPCGISSTPWAGDVLVLDDCKHKRVDVNLFDINLFEAYPEFVPRPPPPAFLSIEI
ncbi:MAG TPA: hypothetical protein PK375_03550 [Rhodocyclaceae bacterium]|nr:hypothetical protein [Rhodocyclaceae bacterium]HNH34963.1 hypothetical protein [Rhodocyclaceae bacterium]